MTELEIINAMLASTGTAPLTTNDNLHPYYIKAKNKLDAVSEDIQSRGWWFNRAERTMTPNSAGEIAIPNKALHVDPIDPKDGLTIRAGKMYDLNNGTFVLTRTIKVDYVDLVEIDDLPTSAASYIRARAVYEFYLDEDGVEPKLSRYKLARDEAWVRFNGAHLRNADLNFFDGTSAAQLHRGVRARRLPLSDN